MILRNILIAVIVLIVLSTGVAAAWYFMIEIPRQNEALSILENPSAAQQSESQPLYENDAEGNDEWTNESTVVYSDSLTGASSTQKAISEDFTVIAIPDTQKYSRYHPDIFCKQTEWIASNKEKFNIVFASHLGDIVDSGDSNMAEWQIASDCMKKIDGVVPYGIIPGNHDTDKNNRDRGLNAYEKYFPATRYNTYPWYKGNRISNQNNYQIIEANGVEILFLNLAIEPSNNTIAWANEVVKKYPSTYTILTTHKYLADNSTVRENERQFSAAGNTGEQIWEKLVKDNCSIRMVWSGHFHEVDGENRIASTNRCGDVVHQIVQDYQSREWGGNGRLRMYSFNPNKGIIKVQTYSPYTNSYETDEDSQFTLPFDYRF